MRDINEIQFFVKTIELGSLTAASKLLNLPKSSISRKIKNLEKRLGVTLLTRTTRALSLTEPGERFYQKSSLALKEIEYAEKELDISKQDVEGVLRLSVPMFLQTGPFNDLIASFLELHPKIKIELHISDTLMDVVKDNFDLVLRLGPLENSTLIVKKIYDISVNFVCTPKFLKMNYL